MIAAPELTGKLDAPGMTPEANGPDDAVLDWYSVDWDQAEESVRRLRQRIFTATREGDLKKVRNLQKLMLRSRSNALVAARRVAEVNAGRKTPGVDGHTALMASQKADLAAWLMTPQARAWKPRPVKRVYIPKANGKRRPLGIPVLRDRARQAMVLSALEPEWEARFEPRSYGFRPGRGCHDAIEAIHHVARGHFARRAWVLDADLAAAFDHIDHDRLLAAIGGFPVRDAIATWLKSGVIENGRFAPTPEGSPQGGVISPLLLNVALHGMEQAAGVRYRTTGAHAGETALDSPVLVRYADDLVALCHSRDQAEQVRQRLASWLAPRGLAFNEDKTRIVHLSDGFDFLGYSIRRYRQGKLLIKPSPAAVARFRNRLRDELRTLRGANALAVVMKLNPILRGWAAYYRNGVSKKVFSEIDDYLWYALYKWARFRHPNKPRKWVTSRYFGAFHPVRRARWIFGDRDTGRYLTKLDWTPIVRHVMVTGNASPDDPDLADYWAQRRKKKNPPVSAGYLKMMRDQHWKCPLCGGYLLHADHEPQHPDEWEKWYTAINRAVRARAVSLAGTGAGTDRTPPQQQLVHAHCEKRLATGAIATARYAFPEPAGLA
jgi:RNA-directed DNA polymerase